MSVAYLDGGDVAAFDGLTFRRDKRTGYYLNAKMHKRLHVYVWEYFNGDIPEGYHVHHKDMNKTNNEIENLVLLPAAEHTALHGKALTSKQKEARAANLKENAVPKAAEWHGTPEGKAWHKQHYEKMRGTLCQKIVCACEYCGKEYESTKNGHNRYCSNNCKAAARRASGIDNEIRICAICGKEFTVNKYAKAQTCSKTCSQKLRWRGKNRENS